MNAGVLPAFLVAENLLYGAAYLAIAYATYSRGSLDGVRLPALVLLGFNMGRVSRSVVSPEGSLQEGWIPHLLLLAFIAAVALAVARGGGGGKGSED